MAQTRRARIRSFLNCRISRVEQLRTYQGAVAIVTGAASGIGRAVSEALAARGASVTLADRQTSLAEEVALGIRSKGGKARAVELDVRDFAANERLVRETVEAEGRLDYMFNNAGIGIGGEVRLYSIDDWYQVLDVNLRGVVHGVHAAYPVMIRQGFGHIVNTASMAGLMPGPMVTSYCTTKHAVVGLSNSLRIEAAPLGVRVSVLCPGVIKTSILNQGGHYGKQLDPAGEEGLRRLLERFRPMAANRFADAALKQVAKNRAIIILPGWWRIFWWLNRLSPSLGMLVSRWQYNTAKRASE